MTAEDLAACIARAQEGERQALSRLLAFVRPLMERQLQRYPLSEEDRRDAAQSAMMQLVRRISSFRGQASFTTWLFRVTANEALMLMRSHRRQRAHLTTELDTDELDKAASCTGGAPEDPALEQERETVVRNALAQLPEHYREVVTAHYHQDLGLHEIAQQMNVTESAVRSRLHRARTQLRGLLSEGPTQPAAFAA